MKWIAKLSFGTNSFQEFSNSSLQVSHNAQLMETIEVHCVEQSLL